MLLLMRRTGEMIRIADDITLQVKEIRPGTVTFLIEGLKQDDIRESGSSGKEGF